MVENIASIMNGGRAVSEPRETDTYILIILPSTHNHDIVLMGEAQL